MYSNHEHCQHTQQKTKKERITAIQFNDDKTKTTNTEKQASDKSRNSQSLETLVHQRT
jgi:hypothetical protein